MPGTVNNPVKLDPFTKIIEVHWNAPIGILTLEAPDISNFTPTNFGNFSIGPYNEGETIEKSDFSGSDRPPIAIQFNDPGSLETLFEAHYNLWEIEAIVGLPGSAPEKPPSGIDLYNAYVAGTGPYTVGGYGSTKAPYITGNPNFSWREVGSLLELPDPVAEGGYLPGNIGGHFTGHWPDIIDSHGVLVWGEFTNLRHIAGTYPATSPVVDDPNIPGYVGAQQWDSWVPAQIVGWGLGAHKFPVNKVIEKVRRVWLIFFKALAHPTDEVDFGQSSDPHSDDLPSATATFKLDIYSGGRFVVGALDEVTNVGGRLLVSGTRTVSYDDTGDTVVKLDRTGFI